MQVLDEVIAELDRATSKFPTWPTDPLHALAEPEGAEGFGVRVTQLVRKGATA